MRRWLITCTIVALIAASLILPGAALARAAAPSAAKMRNMATIGRAQIAAGWWCGYAIRPNGSLWSWGLNTSGQLGLGDTKSRRLPTHLGRSVGWTTIAASDQHCLAVKLDGSLWAWGANDEGQLGIGINGKYGNRPRLRPQRVAGGGWKAVGAGSSEFSIGLKRDGSLWAWGNNDHGDLGLGTTSDVLGSHAVPTRIGTGSDWKAIAVGYDWVFALKSDGSLWAWGDNSSGQLGLGTTDDLAHPTPTRIGSGLDWTAICADTYAIKRDGSLWSWSGTSVPTRVGTGNSWKSVAAGFGDVFALKTDSSLWAWGVNGGGQLGLGDRVARTSPTRVRGGWAKVAVGNAWTLGLKSNGTFWSWGIDHAMQLGQPVVRTRGVPTRIFSLS